MKRNYFIAAIAALVMASCGNTQQKEDYSWIKTSLDRSASQLLLTAHEIDGTGKLPRSIHVGYDMDFLVRQLERDTATFVDSLRKKPTPEMDGKRRLCSVYDWTSGFYPGSLWYGDRGGGKPAGRGAR